MPSAAFTAQLRRDLEDVFANTDEFGQSVTYVQHADGVSTSKVIPAVFAEYIGAIDVKVEGMIIIPLDATLGIANPGRGDKVTIGTDVWIVQDVSQRDGVAASLRVVIHEDTA